jgi:hypothetical protein
MSGKKKCYTTSMLQIKDNQISHLIINNFYNSIIYTVMFLLNLNLRLNLVIFLKNLNNIIAKLKQ